VFKSNSNPIKYKGNEEKYLKKVLRAESWSATAGSWNQILENEFAKKFDSKFAIAMNSGTATLHASLVALGVKRGDEIITPSLTVIMDTTAILHAHAIPVYVDIDKETFNLDPKKVESAITPRTKAIIAVSLYGLPPELDSLRLISKKYEIPLIEDNAQCFLSTFDGKLAGTYGDVSSWSFENTKHISCGEGGIVTTDQEDLAIKIRKVAGHGFKNLSAKEGRVRLNQEVFQDPDYKRHDTLGWNYRLPEFNAAVALAQLERLDELVAMRVEVANLFREVISDSNYFIEQTIPKNRTHSFYTLGVRYIGDNKGVSWRDFRKAYVEEGGDGIYGAWSVPYLEPLMASRKFVEHDPEIYSELEFPRGLCPVAEEIQPQIMQFKTNYRSISLAKKKANILRKIIRKLL
jgi:perosamine synthetase